MVGKKPIPETTGITGEYWERLRAGELCIQQCSRCGASTFPPRPYCIECYADEWEYVPIDGEGTVYGYTIIYRSPTDEFDPPVVSAVVEMTEGPRIMGHVQCDPDEISVGTLVEFDPSPLSSKNVRITFQLQ